MERIKDNLQYIIFGFVLGLLGLLLLIFRESLVYVLLELTQIFLIILLIWEVMKLWRAYRQRGKVIEQLMSASKIFLIIIIGVIVTSFPAFITSIFVYLVGTYQLIIGMIGLLSYAIIYKDRAKVDRSLLWIPLVHLVFGISTFVSPLRISQTLLRLAIYLNFVGATFVTDGSRMMLSRRRIVNKLSSRIRIPLPVFLEAIIPNRFIVRFNRELEHDKPVEDLASMNRAVDVDFTEESVVHVLIQVGASGFDKIGHVDVSYKGKVYSYGNHDVDSHKLFGAIGDGVLIEANEKKYLAYLKSRRVNVLRFGILLNHSERVSFQEALANLLNQTSRWTLTSDNQRNSFIGRVMHSAEGIGFKFQEGRYKSYFVLGTNCVLLVDELLGANGINIINLSGILSPGSYYDYFDKLFRLKGSNVISKTLVHPKLESDKTVYNLD